MHRAASNNKRQTQLACCMCFADGCLLRRSFLTSLICVNLSKNVRSGVFIRQGNCHDSMQLDIQFKYRETVLQRLFVIIGSAVQK